MSNTIQFPDPQGSNAKRKISEDSILEAERGAIFMPHHFLMIPWDTMRRAITAVARQLPENATIWGVPRGGTLIATMMTYIRPDITLHPALMESAQDLPTSVIIVDDIADTGTTLQLMDPQGNHTCATIFMRASCPIHPTYTGVVIRTKSWLLFPWEYEPLELPRT